MVKFELVKSFLDFFYAGFQFNCDLISLAILLQRSDIGMMNFVDAILGLTWNQDFFFKKLNFYFLKIWNQEFIGN